MSCGVGLLPRSGQVMRRHVVLLDVVVATALTGGAMWAVTTLRHDGTVAITVLAAIICTSAVGWRRLAPAPAACVTVTGVAVYQVSGQDTQGAFVAIAVVLTCFWVGRAVSSLLLQVGVAGYALTTVTIVDIDAGFSLGNDLLTWVPLAVLPMIAGGLVSRRDALVRRLRVVRSRLQGADEIARARAVVDERTRVARELHDVVAHCVSVMVIQAGAARLLTASDVDAARDAVRVVAASGREALIDLRRVVGVRRRGEDGFAGATPGLAQLPHLVEQTRGAGTSVRLHLVADASLPAELDLVVFRIVQEALTNVRKHAPGAAVEVSVLVGPDDVDVMVEDTGPATVADETGAGQGLIGIRERIELHGGEMLSGTTSSGGFALRARLPLFALPASTDSDDAVPASTEDAGPALWQRFRTRVDGVISLAWLVPLEIEAVTSTHRTGPMAVGVAVVAGMALAGLIRRRAPISFLVTAGALSLVLSGGIASPQHASVVNAYIVVFGAYTVAAYCPQPRALAGLAFLLAGAIVTTVVHHAAAGVALGGCLLACAAWITGRIVRNQRQIIADLATATARLSAERDSRALMARAAERVRIARDLQAIVARLVVTMVVQAESAEDQLAHDPVRAVEAIAGIEHMGRGALVQLRQILGVLRNRAGAAPQSSPQRGQQLDTVLDELVRVPS